MTVCTRVTRVICPSCEGSGRGLLGVCQWCRGEKKLSVSRARQFADQLFCIAGGGYIAGDHDCDDARRMEAQAKQIYELTGETAPWL